MQSTSRSARSWGVWSFQRKLMVPSELHHHLVNRETLRQNKQGFLRFSFHVPGLRSLLQLDKSYRCVPFINLSIKPQTNAINDNHYSSCHIRENYLPIIFWKVSCTLLIWHNLLNFNSKENLTSKVLKGFLSLWTTEGLEQIILLNNECILKYVAIYSETWWIYTNLRASYIFLISSSDCYCLSHSRLFWFWQQTSLKYEECCLLWKASYSR